MNNILDHLNKPIKFVLSYVKQGNPRSVKIKKNIIIQKKIGESSWFGFALILKNKLEGKRKQIVNKLMSNGIEVRPIVAGNFTRNKAIKYMDYEISDNLVNADYIHENGFFVGNHSEIIEEEITTLKKIINEF